MSGPTARFVEHDRSRGPGGGDADLEDLVGADPRAALERAAELAHLAAAAGDDDLGARALGWRAEALQRLGDTAGAAAAVTSLRERPDLPADLSARASWLMARVLTDLGDAPTALEHALDAANGLDATTPPRLRTLVLIKVADVLDDLGALEDARTWYARAEELAAGDARLHMLVVNNRAYCEHSAGNTDRALLEARSLGDLSRRYRRALDAKALDTVARVELLAGEVASAVRTATRAVESIEQMSFKNAADLPQHLLTLAVAQRAAGDPEAAAATLDRAQAVVGDFGALRAQLLAERAELLADRGDFRAAFTTHKAFYAAVRELTSERREAQARLRQTMFDVSAVRRDADRFREEARRDALTGLRNRLHVDERLPELLADALAAGEPLVVVLFDLDDFKSVNDTHSHEAGDEVLRRFAALLSAAVGADGPGFAARQGGEEFLLVLPGVDAEGGLAAAEGVRARAAATDWSSVTPGRGVTVSAGVALAGAGLDRTTLLRTADRRLYAAKTAGRNRVVTTG